MRRVILTSFSGPVVISTPVVVRTSLLVTAFPIAVTPTQVFIPIAATVSFPVVVAVAPRAVVPVVVAVPSAPHCLIDIGIRWLGALVVTVVKCLIGIPGGVLFGWLVSCSLGLGLRLGLGRSRGFRGSALPDV
jgi:hypothetical protein